MSNKILVMQRHAPYGNSIARDGLDYILTCAAYDQELSVIFMGDGVFQLIANQEPANIQLKTHLGVLELFELYDISRVYAVREDLLERHIAPDMLGIKVIEIDRQEVGHLIQQQHQVIGF